ncbi:MAG: hypothetical protein V4603_16805 [Pseudomonadota bacterium]
MKKLFITKLVTTAVVTTLFSITAVQAAEVRLVPSDSSTLSALCVEAAGTAANGTARSLKETAAAYGIARHEISEIRCNGQPLERFAAKFKSRNAIAQKDYIFNQNEGRATTSFR